MPGVENKIRKIRREKDFSQEYIAEQLGISQSHYSKIERGEVEITMIKLLKLAKLFEVDVKDLI